MCVCSAEFDFEDRPQYMFFLQVMDNSPVAPRPGLSEVTVQLENIDDEPTIFNQTQYSKCVYVYVIRKWEGKVQSAKRSSLLTSLGG